MAAKHKSVALEHGNNINVVCSTVQSSINALFWSLFGMTDLSSLEVNTENEDSVYKTQTTLLRWLFGTYNVVAIVILLNMLIAMMAHSYDNVLEKSKRKCKFGFSKKYQKI